MANGQHFLSVKCISLPQKFVDVMLSDSILCFGQ